MNLDVSNKTVEELMDEVRDFVKLGVAQRSSETFLPLFFQALANASHALLLAKDSETGVRLLKEFERAVDAIVMHVTDGNIYANPELVQQNLETYVASYARWQKHQEKILRVFCEKWKETGVIPESMPDIILGQTDEWVDEDEWAEEIYE